MNDLTRLSDFHTSEAARIRLKKRHASDLRLRIYGILAICFAAAALIVLLSDNVRRAVGALHEHYVVFETHVAADEFEIADDMSSNRVAGLFSNYERRFLKAAFPVAAKSRRQRRELYAIMSGDAGYELGKRIHAGQYTPGETADIRYLLSDDADLYLKGFFGPLKAQVRTGALTVTPDADGKTATVGSSFNDFDVLRGFIKANFQKQAALLEEQALRDQRAVDAARTALEATPADQAEIREKAEQEFSRRLKTLQLRQEKAADLKRRATDMGPEALSDDMPSAFIRAGGGWLKITGVEGRQVSGEMVIPFAGEIRETSDWQLLIMQRPQSARKFSDRQIIWLEALRAEGRVERVFNGRFFTSGDSTQPELAGILGAILGSFWTMLVTLLLAFPVGVLAAIYLEEFAPQNRITNFIEVNINNLAAVPSIVFGLLGLAIFLGPWFDLGRSWPLVGGMVLALKVLPTIIIASRASIRAVPPSIRNAALGLGASKVQTVFHHVVPLAMPGILTGTIIGMAQALGETAPLLLIGMNAFVVEPPSGMMEPAAALPAQIFQWADHSENAFDPKTSAAVLVLLAFLVIMNALAVLLRKRFERRW